MAATGYSPIQIYSSSTGGTAPTAGNLTNSTLGSELAINITDGYLYYKDNANAVQKIGYKLVPIANGGTNNTAFTAKSGNVAGLVFYDGTKLANDATVTDVGYDTSTNTVVANLIKANSTIGVGAATPAASGAGITFPGTQSSSSDVNTLDDYEEGTWTPTYEGSTTNPTCSYSVQVGVYTKIGNVVQVQCRITLSSTSGGTGSLRIAGLPFAALSTTNSHGTANCPYKANWTTNGPSGGYIVPAQTYIYLGYPSATGFVGDTPADLSNNCQLILAATYLAAT